ncbi:uncharacterized protein METZ01_LOCUS79774 [marine metagenome]|uniref:Uncharacterized protein n=1 Tax=marine metagenome TaxID=408172 RepID=A0A381UFK4_9ZZZZ
MITKYPVPIPFMRQILSPTFFRRTWMACLDSSLSKENESPIIFSGFT